MKKFYITLFALTIIASALFYFSFWFSIAGLAGIMTWVAYRYYSIRLQAARNSNVELERHMEALKIQLENAVLKEQKTSKDAERIREMKQELFSVLSHEIRTPMNGVLGMALLLEETVISKEQKEYVTTIRSCGESLLTTINNILANDILDFSKFQRTENILEFKDFDLRDAAEEVLELFAGQARKAGIDLVCDINEDVPSQIIGDSKRLRQVVMNLVENAVKFTRKGEILLSIYNMGPVKAGFPPELAFEIKDSGIGIDPDELSRLFNGIPGKTVHQATPKGSQGLGLVICRQLVELMGGRIEAKSEPGNGSVFTFCIPIIPSTKPKRHQLQLINLKVLEGKRILIIDDNETSRNSLMKLARSWNMSVLSAEAGKKSLDILSVKNDFDLVLTDIDMPEINGVPVFRLSKPVRQSLLRDNIVRILSNTSTGEPINANPISVDFSCKFPLRMMVVEDNIINQKIATKFLAKLGYESVVANNGKEAIELISQDHFDIILMDVQMPEMDGLEATRMIRTCIDIQPIIIAMTANAMQGDRDACIQSGMDDYISKPIEINELLNQLEKWALVIKEKKKLSA